jgi:large subunit ribosomal protein L29
MKRNDHLKTFRAMSIVDLDKEVLARKQKLMELRIQGAVSTVPNPSQINTLRKEVAQLLTLATEKRSEGLSKKVK